MKRTLEERIFAYLGIVAIIAVLLVLALPALADDKRVMIELEVGGEYTVIHVRQTDDERVRYYGWHESGVYPWQVVFDLCSFCVLEYRLGNACTEWNPATGLADRVKEGRRQKPCEWTEWMPVPLNLIRPAPPELSV